MAVATRSDKETTFLHNKKCQDSRLQGRRKPCSKAALMLLNTVQTLYASIPLLPFALPSACGAVVA